MQFKMFEEFEDKETSRVKKSFPIVSMRDIDGDFWIEINESCDWFSVKEAEGLIEEIKYHIKRIRSYKTKI